MSLFSDYHKEQGIYQVIESDHGFITYCVMGIECYIGDLYVTPEKRRSGLAKSLVDLVKTRGIENGCKIVSCSIIPQTNNPEISKQFFESLGFRVFRKEPNAIWYLKEL